MAAAIHPIQQCASNLYANGARASFYLFFTCVSGSVAVGRVRAIAEAAKTVFQDYPSLTSSVPGLMRAVGLISFRAIVPAFVLSLCLTVAQVGLKGMWRSVTTPPIPEAELPKEISLELLELRVQAAERNPDDARFVSQTAGEICGALLRARNADFPDPLEVNIGRLKPLCQRMQEVIERVAEEQDAEKDAALHDAFMVLGSKGLRNPDWQRIARELGFSGDDYPFVSLKLAEKGIFTEQHLRDHGIVSNDASAEFMVQSTIYALLAKNQQQQVERPQAADFQDTFWTKLPRVLDRADELASKTFAVAFKALSLYVAFVTYSSVTIPTALIFTVLGMTIAGEPANPSSFYQSNLVGRVIWVARSSMPWLQIFVAIGQGLKDGDVFRSLQHSFFE